jgi:heme-degrading monooxygenase HmoA
MTYVIIWQYQAKTDRVAEFEKVYASDGTWAALFQKADGYLGTELVRHHETPTRFLTIDRWASREAYEAFKAEWNDAYAELDAQCEHLTEKERLLGKYEADHMQ